MPAVSRHKLNQIIKYEVQQQIPFPVSEVVWDYQLLKTQEETTQENTALIVAAKADIVNSLLDKFEGLGSLHIDSIQPTQLAVLNLVNYIQAGQRTIILDIGAKATNIIILDEKNIFSRSILIAGNDITKALAIKSNISIKEAEIKKRQMNCLESPAIMGVLTDLLTEISQSINYYKSQFVKAKGFDRVLLTGTAELKNLDKFLFDNLNIPVERLSFARNVKTSANLKLNPQTEDRLATAFGLAISGATAPGIQINLLPQELLKFRYFKERCWYLCGSLAVSIILVILLTRFTLVSNRIDSVQLNYWQNLLNNYQNYDKTITQVQDDINAQKTKVELLEDLIVLQSYWLDVMLELEAALTPDMWYTSLSKEGDFLVLEGKTRGTFSDITIIKEKLQQSKFFKDIQVSSAKVEQGAEIKAFSIKMKVVEGREYFASFITRYRDIMGGWPQE